MVLPSTMVFSVLLSLLGLVNKSFHSSPYDRARRQSARNTAAKLAHAAHMAIAKHDLGRRACSAKMKICHWQRFQ